MTIFLQSCDVEWIHAILSKHKRFKYWHVDYNLTNQWLVLRESKQKLSPPQCSLIVLLGERATSADLVVDGENYHMSMGMTEKRLVAYHIKRFVKCTAFAVDEIQGLAVEMLRGVNLNLAWTRLRQAIPDLEVPTVAKVKYVEYVRKNAGILGEGRFLTTYNTGEKWLHKLDDFHMQEDPDNPMMDFLLKCQANPGFAYSRHGARSNKKQKIAISSEEKWPFPIFQQSGKDCAVNVCRNVGITNMGLEFAFQNNGFCSLMEVAAFINQRKKTPWTLTKVQEIEASGLFVVVKDGHCLSVVDGLYLDPDEKYPHPVRDLGELNIFGRFDRMYRVLRKK